MEFVFNEKKSRLLSLEMNEFEYLKIVLLAHWELYLRAVAYQIKD